MSLWSFLTGQAPEQKQADVRHEDILAGIHNGQVPYNVQLRLSQTASGRLPWLATLTPAELLMARTHGFKPISAVSATCWLYLGHSWTLGHQQGWEAAIKRLADEAKACGANAVLDVKMRTIPLSVNATMDFTLVGTAVRIEGLPPSIDPVIATLPALEFIKLLEADIIPTGLAVGADYNWMRDLSGSMIDPRNSFYNTEAATLSQFWRRIRENAYARLRQNAQPRGNGLLAHTNFSQVLEFEREEKRNGEDVKIKEYLARHIIVATTLDVRRGTPLPHDFKIVVDLHAGETPLTNKTPHHQTYQTTENRGAI